MLKAGCANELPGYHRSVRPLIKVPHEQCYTEEFVPTAGRRIYAWKCSLD